MKKLLLAALLCAALGPAQVVTIKGSDTVQSSRDVLNSNFAWLNANKVGAVAGTTNQIHVTGGSSPVLSFEDALLLRSNVTNPTTGGDANDRRAWDLNVTTDSSTSNPNFSNENGMQISQTIANGQASYGGGTNAKKTFQALSLYTIGTGSGQKFNKAQSMYCYGMSDCFNETNLVQFAGGPVQGDEGDGFQSVSGLYQQGSLTTATVNGSTTNAAASCNTTTTQAITASKDPQTVTVANSTGCAADGWVVIAQGVNLGTPNIGLTHIISRATGSITGVFLNSQSSGVTVTASKIITPAGVDIALMGQDRVLVNWSGTSYTTGTATNTPGTSEIVGTGTSWANNMVGGSATNIGVFCFDSDDYDGYPFSASVQTLHSCYEITSVVDGTHLHFHSFSVAADAAYHGVGGPSTYHIYPGARILGNSSGQLKLESTTATWNDGDSIECLISPYPDVTGKIYHLAQYTPGGVRRSMWDVVNVGARTWGPALRIYQQMQTGSNADTAGYQSYLEGSAEISLYGMNFGGRHYAVTAADIEGVALRLATYATDGTHGQDPKLLAWQSGDYGSTVIGTDPATGYIDYGSGFGVEHYSQHDYRGITDNRHVIWPDKGGTVAFTSDTGSPGSFVATIPAAVGDRTVMGSFAVTSVPYGACFRMSVAATDGIVGGAAKSYAMCSLGAGSGWLKVAPIGDKDTAVDFDLDVEFIHNSTFSFGLRKTSGTNAMTAQVNLAIIAPTTFAWTACASSCTSTVTPPTTYLSSDFIEQSSGLATVNGGIASGGTKFTLSGCSAGTTLGGATAGSFASGTTGACTVVLTFNGATGATAKNGWSCNAQDITTPANIIGQTATSTTTATISGTTASGDVVNFSCVGY